MQKRIQLAVVALLNLALVFSLVVGSSSSGQAAPLAALPVVFDLAPGQGQTVAAGGDGKVRVGATFRADVAITAYQVLIDNSAYSFPPPVFQDGNRTLLLYSFIILTNGTHNIYVSATDANGQAGGFAWNFTVTGSGGTNPTSTPVPVNPTATPLPAGKLPAIENLQPGNGLSVSSPVVRIGFTIRSTATIIGRNIVLDNSYIQYTREGSGLRETIYVNVQGLSNGPHTVTASASDTAGRYNTATWTFYYGVTAPTPTPGGGSGCTGSYLFPQTGKCVSPAFYRYWQANGDLAAFGFPLSNEIQERSDSDGRTYAVQYFERARFEYHPENAAPFNVLLGLIGVNFHPRDPAVAALPGRSYFPQTGHNVSTDFYQYWQQHGSLSTLGFPISEEFVEIIEGRPYTVQYFERARFERHPENAVPYNVLLGQLGRTLYQQKYPDGRTSFTTRAVPLAP